MAKPLGKQMKRKNTECTLKPVTEKEEFEHTESYQDEQRIHQAFTPTKELQKIQYLETQIPNITKREKLKRK